MFAVVLYCFPLFALGMNVWVGMVFVSYKNQVADKFFSRNLGLYLFTANEMLGKGVDSQKSWYPGLEHVIFPLYSLVVSYLVEVIQPGGHHMTS